LQKFSMAYRIFIGCLLLAALAGCGDAGQKPGSNPGAALAMQDSARFTTVQWLDSVRDYGKIPEGQKLDVSFRFRNTGNTPLVIGDVHPSCGCTVAETPKEPIAPGGEGQIKASFNSDGRAGINHKSLIVTTNTRGTQRVALQFTVEVEKKS
jgi:hypothetical protein